VNYVNTINNVLRWTNRTFVRWSPIDDLTFSVFVNLEPSYLNTAASPAQRVSPWQTVDLNVSYVLPKETFASELGGVELDLSVHNIGDADPPFVNQGASGSSGYGYDPQNASAFGRLVDISLAKHL
jgi:hypothetical protein